MTYSDEEAVGETLSGATVTRVLCDLYEPYETSIKVGMFLIITDPETNQRLLARVANIKPEHSFYRPGDAWSGARRAQVKFPREVGTKYVSCELEVVAKISNGRLEPPRVPPFPGSLVIKPNPTELKKLFLPSSEEAIAEFAGLKDYPTVPIPLLVKNVPMHIGIFGVTGSGKSFTVGVIIEALSKIRYKNTELSYPMIIIDSHGDYREYGIEGEKYGVKGELYGLPGSDRRKFNWIYMDLRELTFDTLAEMIVSFYSGVEIPSPIQVWALKFVIEEYCKFKGWTNNPDNRLFSDDSTYNELLNWIYELRKKPKERPDHLKKLPTLHAQTADAISRALDKFRDATRADKLDRLVQSWNWTNFLESITKEGKAVVIDLSPEGAPNTDITVKQLFIGYLAYTLFNKFSEYKSQGEDKFLLLVIEESQNYCPNISLYAVGSPHFAKKYLSLIATQGRKFGASLALITQRPAFVDRAILSQCNTFFIHRIAPGDVDYVLTVTGGLPTDLARRLTILERGELILSGVMSPTFFPIVVEVTREHRKAPHKAGTVNPAKTLYYSQKKAS